MPTNKYAPDEMDLRHNALEHQTKKLMVATAHAVAVAHEARNDEYLAAQYARTARELGAAYKRLVRLASHL